MMSSTMAVNTIPTFFEPVRRTALESLLGYFPVLSERDAVVRSVSGSDHVQKYSERTDLPTVTYISRQGTGRRLISADHDGLVRALRALEAEGLCEVVVAEMEGMTVAEQLAAIAKSTVSLFLSLLLFYPRRRLTLEF
jgi:protein O-GlcNAc transferase